MNIKKLFKFPTPIELGVSKHNALSSKMFTPKTSAFTWEDYYNLLAKEFPIRWGIYICFKTIKDFLHFKILKKIELVIDYFRYKYYYKYHILKLSQPKSNTSDDYSYGYRDCSDQMTYAVFNILNTYIKSINLDNETVLNYKNQKNQYDAYLEMLTINNWWCVIRKEKLKKYNNALDEHFKLKEDGNDDFIEKQSFDYVNAFEEHLNNELDEMLLRTLKVRNYMWN